MPATKTPVSGYRSHVRVEMSNGDQLEIQTKLTDVLRWETNNHDKSWMQFPMPLKRQLEVLYIAARRLKLTDSLDGDGWAAQVVDFEDIEDRPDDEDGEVEVIALDPTASTTSTS